MGAGIALRQMELYSPWLPPDQLILAGTALLLAIIAVETMYTWIVRIALRTLANQILNDPELSAWRLVDCYHGAEEAGAGRLYLINTEKKVSYWIRQGWTVDGLGLQSLWKRCAGSHLAGYSYQGELEPAASRLVRSDLIKRLPWRR